MKLHNRADRIDLLDFHSVPMRAFHMSWFAFFASFFAWFGVAPLMPVIRQQLDLSQEQIGNTLIASVTAAIFVRLIMGWLCDRIGPRKSYTGLLVLCSIPVLSIGLAQNYETFLLFRFLIGAVGASFVITQYHTSVMFASNCVGTANATTAGWGNLGGGIVQIAMPLLLSGVLWLGVGDYWGWRIAMLVPGGALLIIGAAYFFLTQDFPEGNLDRLQEQGVAPKARNLPDGLLAVLRDYRVWILFIAYGACFGAELTVNNIGGLYFTDVFELSLTQAGFAAGLFGFMNIFARSLGGYLSDRASASGGLRQRAVFLAATLLLEGVLLTAFCLATALSAAIVTLIGFSLFVQMAEGATFALIPFINRDRLGSVAGVVGAGGNVGAVLYGFLFRSESASYAQGLGVLAGTAVIASLLVLCLRFSTATEREIYLEFERSRS